MESPTYWYRQKLREVKKENEDLKKLLSDIKEDLKLRAKVRGDVDSDGCVVVDLSHSLFNQLSEVTKDVPKVET